MGILEILGIILLISWIGGFSLHIAGSAIHFLLVLALILFLLSAFKVI